VGARRESVRSVWLPATVLVALVLGAVVLQLRVADATRADIDEEYRVRTNVAADYISSFVDDLFTRQEALARDFLSEPTPRAGDLARAAGAIRYKAAVLLAADGTVLAAFPEGPGRRDPTADAGAPHVRAALGGERAVSGALGGGDGRLPAFGLALPFDTDSGRRVLAVVIDPRSTPVLDHLAQAFPLEGQAGVLVDDAGRIIAAGGAMAGRAGLLAEHAPALAERAVGDGGESVVEGSYEVDGSTRRFRAQAVDGTPWRLVAVSPDATQYGLVTRLGRAQTVVLGLLAVSALWTVRLLVLARRRAALLAAAATTDPLTGAGNRRQLDEWSGPLEPATRVAAVVVDLDHFKAVNDLFGHAVGDEVLIACAARLRSVVRADDEVLRWGGEEFAAVLRGADVETARQLAERFRQALAAPIATAAGPLEVTASVGCAAGSIETLADTIRRADVALYEAKQRGRDRVVVGAAA
jgi:diguanylate cyclase (GGDEF)-like protein